MARRLQFPAAFQASADTSMIAVSVPPLTRRHLTRIFHRGENDVSNDKVFGFYALGLIAMVVTMWSSLVALGIATLPSMAFLVEHAFMGLCIRAGYKSFAGFDWFWSALELVGFVGPRADEIGDELPGQALAA
jgi:hypothetical protein